MSERYDAIVIGGGIGGLATAALLSEQKRRVLLCETSEKLGGFQHRFAKNGFTFEPHFHFLQDAGPGRPVRELLRGLGIEPAFTKLDPIAQFQFPDRVVTVGNDRSAFITQLCIAFPAEATGIEKLFVTMHGIYQALTKQQPSALLAQHGADTMHAFMSRFVSDNRLKTIIGGWSAYFGYGSDQIAALAIIVFTEACWDGGIYHPVGGISTVVRALQLRIESAGGTVRTSTPVQRIIIDNNSRVRGVDLGDGSRIESDCVVSNVDAGTTFSELLENEPAAAPARQRLSTLRRFRSPFCVYLGVRSEGLGLSEGAAVRVIFDSYDLQAQDRAQLAGDVEHAPVSLGIPTMTNPELAPDGHDIVILYTFLPSERIDALLADNDAARVYAERLVRQAERAIPGLSRQVVLMETSASATRELYTHYTKGAIGWEPMPDQLPAMPTSDTDIIGLYLAGQWTRTGGGMNNVLASAQIVASMCAASTRDA